MDKHESGFTLVELMIVVTIIGILAAIAVPQYGNAIARARCAVVPPNLNRISTAQEAYHAETNKYLDNRYWGYPSHLSYSDDCANSSEECLGLSIKPSKYFKFTTQKTNTGYNVTAKVIKVIGKTEIDNAIKMNEKKSVTLTPSGSALNTYLSSFINQMNK